MRRVSVLVVVLAAFLHVGVAAADDGDRATIARGAAFIGDQAELTIEVRTPKGASVEVDPAAASWNGVSVVRVESAVSRDEGDHTVHTIRVIVAPFAPGDLTFSPAVSVVADSVATPRTLPAVSLRVASTLRPNEPLELTPLPAPGGIGGAESPLLKPGIVIAVIAASLAIVTGLVLATRAVAGWLRRPRPEVATDVPTYQLGDAERLLHTDPVGAYRGLAAAVRRVLVQRYGFPASALTTRELRQRMESEGVDRWQSRLVTGLLEECDAVVYAGYRPAGERREADLIAAREIVEGAG